MANIAGIMAAKKTSELIPLSHPLPINFIDVGYAFRDESAVIEITSTVKVEGVTGVEMEAMTCRHGDRPARLRYVQGHR